MLTKGLRRFRKPNYTREETEILLDQLLRYGNILFGKSQPGVNNQQRADVWANIAALVNSVPNSAGRTVEELKHRWQDLAQRARVALRKSSDDKQRQMPYMDKVLRVMGETRSDSNSTTSKGNLSPAPSTDTSDPDASCSIEIKQETIETDKESFPPVKHTGNSLKRVLPPLKTPSLKRFKMGNSYGLSTNYNQNGIPSLTSYQSVNHNFTVGDPQSTSFQMSQMGRKPYSTLYNRRDPRPMVLDPESHLIMEVDMMDEENKSNCSTGVNNEDDIYDKDSTPVSPAPDNPSTRGTVHHENSVHIDETGHCSDSLDSPRMQEEQGKSTRTSFGTIYNIHSQAGVEDTNDVLEIQHLETMTTQQLERQCLISKIRLQNQQRSYVKLKEEKLHVELEFLRTKTSHLISKNTEITPVCKHGSPTTTSHRSDNAEECHQPSDLTLKSPNGALEFEMATESSKHRNNDKNKEDSDSYSKSVSKTCVQNREGEDYESNSVQGGEEEGRLNNHDETDSEFHNSSCETDGRH